MAWRNNSIKAAAGNITVEALQKIELKVGQNSLVIDQKGVTIKGMMIAVEGTVKTDVKGLMTSVAGTAMLDVKGALVKIGP